MGVENKHVLHSRCSLPIDQRELTTQQEDSMAKRDTSVSNNTPGSSSRGMGDVPATIIVFLTSLLVIGGIAATLNALVFNS
jgi:hypothetical protein